MVSTGLNQGGGGVSDPVRSLIRLEQSWEIGTIVDMCGYYTQTQARLHSRLIPANYPHVTPCYWGGTSWVGEGAIRPNIRQLDATLLRGIVTHQLLCYSSSSWPFQEGVLCFLHRKYNVFDRLDLLCKC